MGATTPDRLSCWTGLLPSEPMSAWQADAKRILREAETRRRWADYDTGSITEFEAYLLRALAEHFTARVVIEVGTFIGTSTCALASASTVKAVYTCDISNDCLPATGKVKTFPKVSSAVMLKTLMERGVHADFCFFDGVLRDEDVALLLGVTTPDPVFAIHDYNFGPKERRKHGRVSYETMPRKGIGNKSVLHARWPTHVVIDPLPETTVALMVPESRL